jgi:hypothetical protein
VYYDSYWESLKFSPAERDAWRASFPPAGPGEFEIAPRTARRWADAGFSPERARSTFDAAGVDHHDARRWKWTDPETALRWRTGRFSPEEGGEWAPFFTLDQAMAWRAEGFSPVDAKRWSDIVGADQPGEARSWARAGFDLETATRAVRDGIPLEVARRSLVAPDAPLGKQNGGVHR